MLKTTSASLTILYLLDRFHVWRAIWNSIIIIAVINFQLVCSVMFISKASMTARCSSICWYWFVRLSPSCKTYICILSFPVFTHFFCNFWKNIYHFVSATTVIFPKQLRFCETFYKTQISKFHLTRFILSLNKSKCFWILNYRFRLVLQKGIKLHIFDTFTTDNYISRIFWFNKKMLYIHFSQLLILW